MTQETRAQQHPLIKHKEIEGPYFEPFDSGFYKYKDDVCFIYLPRTKSNPQGVRIYRPKGSVTYTSLVLMKRDDYKKIHDVVEYFVKIENKTVAVFYNYYHAKVFLDSMVEEYKKYIPPIPYDHIELDFEIEAYNFKRVYGSTLKVERDGKSEVTDLSIIAN